jgi:UDP-N-acetylmuramoylalanine--D-glutamate ligase
MLDWVGQQGQVDRAVLELSSFQLEFNKKFAPDIAVWTNFYPNHLDRHGTLEAYLDAKLNLFRYQTQSQVAILSVDIIKEVGLERFSRILANIKSKLWLTTHEDLQPWVVQNIALEQYDVMYVHEGWIMHATIHNKKVQTLAKVMPCDVLSDITFLQNWVQIIAVCQVLGSNLDLISTYLQQTEPDQLLIDHHHRVEFCGSALEANFYDDSKSTVIQSTQAAIEKLALQGRPLIVVVGGLGKGADRRPLADFLSAHPLIKKVYCFGKECQAFEHMSTVKPTLEAVFDDLPSSISPGDSVILSPSGASYDLFKNYEHRGRVFKDLVGGLKSR